MVLLGFTGVAKALSACGSAEALMLADPLLGWSNRIVLIVAAAGELAAAAVLASRVLPLVKLAVVLGLSLNFVAFRFCLWLSGDAGPCPCMGNIYGLLGVEPQTMNFISKLILIYLLAGSGYFLLAAWPSIRRKPEPKGAG